ncbi:hypothetical protein J6590_032952 [Homalodisca vitripennis]|nr:hypothetical protein J6590_032952 [Homalodisca vitripennis]
MLSSDAGLYLGYLKEWIMSSKFIYGGVNRLPDGRDDSSSLSRAAPESSDKPSRCGFQRTSEQSKQRQQCRSHYDSPRAPHDYNCDLSGWLYTLQLHAAPLPPFPPATLTPTSHSVLYYQLTLVQSIILQPSPFPASHPYFDLTFCAVLSAYSRSKYYTTTLILSRQPPLL